MKPHLAPAAREPGSAVGRLFRRRNARFAVPLAVATLAVAAQAYAAGSIVKGRVTGVERLVVDSYAEAAKPDSKRWTWREPSPAVQAKFLALSPNASREVCIAALSTSGGQAPGAPILVRITGGRYVPTTLVVAPGAKITFKNADPFPHKLYSSQKEWGNSEVVPNGTREWTAPAGGGSFEFKDELFPSVRGYVVVEPNAVSFAYPARDSSFTMQLNPGDYVLKAYFSGKAVGDPQNISVKGANLDLRDALVVAKEPTK